jgi:hypothetical protein
VKLNQYEYRKSLEISAYGYPFYALLAALMRDADTDNLEKLRSAFPGIYESLVRWTKTPGAYLDES